MVSIAELADLALTNHVVAGLDVTDGVGVFTKWWYGGNYFNGALVCGASRTVSLMFARKAFTRLPHDHSTRLPFSRGVIDCHGVPLAELQAAVQASEALFQTGLSGSFDPLLHQVSRLQAWLCYSASAPESPSALASLFGSVLGAPSRSLPPSPGIPDGLQTDLEFLLPQPLAEATLSAVLETVLPGLRPAPLSLVPSLFLWEMGLTKR